MANLNCALYGGGLMHKIIVQGQKLKMKQWTFKTGSVGYKAKGTICYRKHYYHAFVTLINRSSVPIDKIDSQVVTTVTSGKPAESFKV